MSWALIALSPFGGVGQGTGVLAASRDIGQSISNGWIDEIRMFPANSNPSGFYLWEGTFANRGECGIDCEGKLRRLKTEEVDYYMNLNGKQLPIPSSVGLG